MSDKKLNIALVNDTYYPNVDGVVKTVDSYARVLGKTNNVTVCVPSQGKTVDRYSRDEPAGAANRFQTYTAALQLRAAQVSP